MTTAPAMERQKGRADPKNPAGSRGFRINGGEDLRTHQTFTFKLFPTEPLLSYRR